MTIPDQALQELAAAQSPVLDEGLREDFTRLLLENPAAMHRDGGSVHLTASAVVLDGPGERIALIWHRKGGFWVQPGGHIDAGETSFESAARREVAEEIGLSDLERLGPGPALLHAHDLSEAFGACRAHWDVRYLLRASAPAQSIVLRPSAESPEVRWVPWDDLPAGTVRDLAHVLTELRPYAESVLATSSRSVGQSSA